VASVVWLVIGAAGLWVSEKLFARGFAIWAIGAAAITAASLVPLFALDVDAGSKVALTVMHVVVAASAVTGQALAQRRAAV
jgi:membrane protein implicated in regulation of membrane protease activity